MKTNDLYNKKTSTPNMGRKYRVATQIATPYQGHHLVTAIKGIPFDSSPTAPKVEGLLFVLTYTNR